MILTLANGTRGGVTVNIMILGLTDENIHRLKEGMPIHVDGRTVDLPGLDVVLMAGRTADELRRDAARAVHNSGGKLEVGSYSETDPTDAVLLDALIEAATNLGMRIVWVPKDGEPTPCAACGEAIGTGGSNWFHIDTAEHYCRYGDGCAHPHEILVDLSKPPKQGENTEWAPSSTPS